jgi:membrane carboxypeptidase/penicillin-binding protein
VKGLRFLVIAMLGAVLLGAIVLPVAWYTTASSLPVSIDSNLDLELALRASIESDRQTVEIRKEASRRKPISWERPDFTKLPKDLVSMYMTEMGCPRFFQTPRESGWAWTRRTLDTLRKVYPDGDGFCEMVLVQNLALQLGAKSTLEYAVMADKIHRHLQKDEMVAFDLLSRRFGNGLVGIDVASRVLLDKELAELTLSETAELVLALDFWKDIANCTNEPLIRLNRDKIIGHLEYVGLTTRELAKIAKAQPPRCMQVKH